MQAIGFYAYGGPEVLELVEIPMPEPGPGEVRIRVSAATINPTDILMRGGARADVLSKFEPPYVAGMEAAGVVDAVGEGVEWHPGDEVMAIVVPARTGRGAQGEYCVVPSGSVTKIPAGLTAFEAATIPMNGLTVRRGFDLFQPERGSSLLVTGAAGAVGGYAVEFGAAAGLRVIGVASEADEELVRSLGATEFVARGNGFASRVIAAAGLLVDAAIDAGNVGPVTLGCIRDGGSLIVVRRPFAGETERSITIHEVSVSDYAENTGALDDLRVRVEAGQLHPRVADIVAPRDVGSGQARLEAGGLRGRLVIAF